MGAASSTSGASRSHGTARRPLDGEIIPPGARHGDERGDEAKVRRGFWRTLKRAARQIPFTHDLVAAYYCALDPAVPWRVRATLIGALAYFVSPIDAIPDFIAGVGFGDDATVLLAAIAMVGAHMTDAHRQRAKDVLSR